MEVQFGPNSVDEPNLLYKLQRKIKVFNTKDTLPNRGYNLVASSSKYGLVFVAVPDGVLTVYPLSQLINNECEAQHLTVQLQEKPTHIAVSCDSELLAVTGGQLLSVYKVTEFQNSNVAPTITMRTDVNLSTFVAALQWNPCIPDSIAIAFYDGTLLACQLLTGQTKKVSSKARCICWSPKGKQLVTGNSDGTLTQYKPDLTPAKTIPAPKLFEGSPTEALAIYWISTYQFAVVFKNATDNSRPAVTILNTPKAGQSSCLNYEDICYSMGSNRPWYYYLHGLAQWNIILCSSSNSMEIATLASADGASWLQWCQSDEARPELPLTDQKLENYPVGISIDTCAIHQLPWGENETLPHMPLLHVLSQSGLLTTFNIINVNKAAAVCTAPELITLPAHVMTSNIPGEVQEPAAAPPVQKSEPQVSVIQQALQSAPQLAAQLTAAPAPIKVPSFQPQTAFTAAPPTQTPEQKAKVETKPAPAPQPQVAAQPKPPEKPQLTPQQIQENEAIKAEQERISKMKMNQELKSMLIKEVNDFQMELYKFSLKTRETQAKLQRDLEALNMTKFNSTLDVAQFKKDCVVDELRSAIVNLKLDLVRAYAVIAEAKTHAEAQELNQSTQADPLTAKRIASVKSLAYYIQTQLDRAHKVLDFKWNEMHAGDPHYKPGSRMIRPILDDIYQPLVKQQEILSRQQVVVSALKKALSECDPGPVFKSTSLLRSTPFKKDPLSKLTKNILNMSIEPETKPKKSQLTAQKLDALRDALSNHKTIKIKPVNVEMRQHLITMRENYEKSLNEKAQTVTAKPDFKPQISIVPQATVKVEPTASLYKEAISAPTLTPPTAKPVATGLAGVARTLFADEPKQEQYKPQYQVPDSVIRPNVYLGPKAVPNVTANVPTMANMPNVSGNMSNVSANMPNVSAKMPNVSATMPNVSANMPNVSANIQQQTDAKTVLKDLLTTKQANLEAKNNANTFMGQKICSPTAFAQSAAPSSSAPSLFTSKPIADMNNMVNKFQPFVAESKPATKTDKPNVKSSETGEPEESAPKTEVKPKPMSNLFGMKPTPLAASTPNVPDVLKSAVQDKMPTKPAEAKSVEKAKENVPEKSSDNIPKAAPKAAEKKETLKPLAAQTANKGFVFGASQSAATISDVKPLDLKTEIKEEAKTAEKSETTEKSTAASVFASVPKPQTSLFTPPPSSPDPAKTETPPISAAETKTDTTPASAASVFSAAVKDASSEPKTTATPQSSSTSLFSSSSQSSIFSATSTSSVFGAKPSIFGTSTFAAATTASSVPKTAASESVATTAASVFASSAPPTSTAPDTDKAASVFSSAATTATPQSVFAAASTASVFGTSSVFGAKPASVFASDIPSPSPFAPTGTKTLFNTTPTTETTVFSSTTTAASAFAPTTTSIFGTATTTASIFASSPSQAASVFGQASQSVFGATTQASLFGATTQASVFGSPSTQTSVFGSPTQTTQASVFGTPTQSTPSSIFGMPTAVTQASVFGGSPQASPSSVFGAPQTSQASIFGSQPATPPAQGSLFGGGESNLFASASISTTTTPSQTSGGNIFSRSSSDSVFGGGTNVFGGSSTFGQSNQAASIFGGAASFGQKPATGSLWGSGGGTTGGFGSSAFGQTATTQSSIFGGGSFSAPSAGAFGTPAQTSPFGSPQQPQQAPAFGGSPVFGSQPVFGQSASFGSPTSSGFGAAASFGGFNKSPSSGFGAPAAFGQSAFGSGGSPGFAAAAQSNSTFESLASQNTLTFGNLAQQSSQTPAPAFNASPSFTGWRG